MPGKRRILVVDDEEKYAAILKEYLERSGAYEVCVEPLGARALAAAKAFRPDLVLLDLIMPDMDGGTVAMQLCADPDVKETPIVFLSGAVSKEDVESLQGEFAGRPFLAKPAGLREMVECIEGQLANKP